MTEQRPKIRMTYILVLICAGILVCGRGYAAFQEWRQQEALLPRLALNSVMKALLDYQKKTGGFPKNLSQLDSPALRKRHPQFTPNGEMFMMNYRYVYFPYTKEVACDIWAIPYGERRDDASTRYMLLWPDRARHWKGPALTPEEAQTALKLDRDDLGSLGLIEQDEIQLKSKKGRR